MENKLVSKICFLKLLVRKLGFYRISILVWSLELIEPRLQPYQTGRCARFFLSVFFDLHSTCLHQLSYLLPNISKMQKINLRIKFFPFLI